MDMSLLLVFNATIYMNFVNLEELIHGIVELECGYCLWINMNVFPDVLQTPYLFLVFLCVFLCNGCIMKNA